MYLPNDHKSQKIPNGRSIGKMAIKCTIKSSIERPTKIYPNCDFWFQNISTIWQPWSAVTSKYVQMALQKSVRHHSGAQTMNDGKML
jgi:hypothetical protein